MRITVLVENTGPSEFKIEHGLSLYIEFNDKKYLLDAGPSDSFFKNAHALSIDLGRVDKAVLSHGHYDHGDGFMVFLNQYKDKVVYGAKNIFDDYYSGSGGSVHYIGLSSKLKQMKNRFNTISKDTKIDEKIYLILDDVSNTKEIGVQKKLYKKVDDVLQPDNFDHELSLVFDTPKGLVICNSCSHAGLESIVDNIKKRLNKPVYAYVGGLHMKSTKNHIETSSFTEEQIQNLCIFIKKNIQYVLTGHCTGNVSYDLLKKYLKDRIDFLTTGKTIEI
ncbi:MBL fold metallo-hydrolase [Faecalitalea cylindroides]|uniref:Metal-dependent hydrolases of the beta-lactamase superfamily II n=2 Tax=Faecalitalea cylindroides TaxID=39483 RepID=D4JDW8_9FIRM|nr:MBL fold metallo-hydrolase [Faecalitalea cylindroides]ERK46364.1 metallo-beta-lactamase domain protein [[Eubacterium] cylindroides ATCC 27803] [Faecalitalea cylindroides ATCC 27803]MEE1449549.1 MBL fold metallo-hydrolase [Faecalitalea cylindroides]CBK88390.1 Metal-dependent hydrolases of the beta-lactamase superfamily II [Faecalitalea cylindroides T2-87]